MFLSHGEISWYDWEQADETLIEFTRRVIDFRSGHPVFHRRGWFQGRPIHGSRVDDIAWFKPDGEEMSEEDWEAGFAKSLGVFLNGEGIVARDPRGERIVDDTFYLLFNAHSEAVSFKLPGSKWGQSWSAALNTADGLVEEKEEAFQPGQELPVQAHSMMVMRRVT
jgi:glycogen operon protein